MAVAFATNTVVADFCVPFIDLGHDRSRKLSALDRFSASGVDFVSLTVGIDSCDIYQTLALLAQERRYFLDNPDRYVLISGVADIRRAKAEGKLAVGFQLAGRQRKSCRHLLPARHPAHAACLQLPHPGRRRLP
jgi:membrane dipeptidase